MLRDPGAAETPQLVEPQRVDAEQDDVRALVTGRILSRCPMPNCERRDEHHRKRCNARSERIA